MLSLEDHLRLNKKSFRLRSGIQLVYFANCSAEGEIMSHILVEHILTMTNDRKYTKALEYWCGHGAIGFDIIGRNIADHVVLVDSFLPAIISCEFTAAFNHLDSRVLAYQYNSISQLPINAKFDLVVGNPPWNYLPDDTLNADGQRLCVDLLYQSLQDFFVNIDRFLSDGADVFVYHTANVTEICDLPQNIRFVDSVFVSRTVRWGDTRLFHFRKSAA